MLGKKNLLKNTISLFAFTLAEVLIVIGIIGIVAEVTIPTLVKSFERQTTISQLRKIYGTLQTVQQKVISENGTIENWGLVEQQNIVGMDQVFRTMFAPNLQVSKYCGPSWDSQPGCWAQGCDIQGNNCSPRPQYGCVYAMLNDGTSLVFFDATNTAYTPVIYYSMRIYVDVNGLKGPNRWGRDRFIFETDDSPLRQYKLYPYGDNPYEWNKASREACWSVLSPDPMSYQLQNGVGSTCAYTIIMLDNWQMTTDNTYWK